MVASKDGHPANVSQAAKFEQAARELGCHDDPDRFRERGAKLVRHKRVEKPVD